jgi:hypothetical protein
MVEKSFEELAKGVMLTSAQREIVQKTQIND